MKLLEGTLITLEPLNIKKHAKGYFEMAQDEKIYEYIGNTVPKSINEVQQLLQQYETYFMNWIIIDNDTNSIIGILRISKPKIENGVLVVGESQRLHSKYWRKGHMKESKRLLYKYLFDELDINVLYADVWEGNINSKRSLESYGYKLIDVKREVFSKTGKLMKQYLYCLTREDYYNSL